LNRRQTLSYKAPTRLLMQKRTVKPVQLARRDPDYFQISDILTTENYWQNVRMWRPLAETIVKKMSVSASVIVLTAASSLTRTGSWFKERVFLVTRHEWSFVLSYLFVDEIFFSFENNPIIYILITGAIGFDTGFETILVKITHRKKVCFFTFERISYQIESREASSLVKVGDRHRSFFSFFVYFFNYYLFF